MSDSQDPAAIGCADIMAQMARYELRLAVVNAKTKTAIMAALAAAGIATVTVVFDGYGDSGAVEHVEVSGEVEELPAVEVEVFGAGWDEAEAETQRTTSLKQAVEGLALSFLAQTHSGWENNDGAYGDVVFDVPTDTITLDYNERITTSENHQHVL